MRIGYSPFDMCNEAVRIIESHQSCSMSTKAERQVILLLNKADLYKEMSTYQMSVARKKFAEYYYSNNLTGSALEQYQLAIGANPKIPIKKRLKELLAISKSDLTYSLDANMVGEPDMSNLEYYEFSQPLIDPSDQLKKDAKSAEFYGMSLEEYRKWKYDLQKKTDRKLRLEASEDDSIYDPEFENMLSARLEKLGEPYISEFLRLRPTKSDGTLSAKSLSEMLLSSMEESHAYRKKKNNT